MSDRPVNFLIVDDFSSMRTILKMFLDKCDSCKAVFEAANVAQAQEIMDKQHEADEPIEFILCDWEMPGATGLDFLHWVRKNENFQTIPFIMITTVNEKEKVLDAIMSGANNYLIKPFNPDDLEKKMGVALGEYMKKA